MPGVARLERLPLLVSRIARHSAFGHRWFPTLQARRCAASWAHTRTLRRWYTRTVNRRTPSLPRHEAVKHSVGEYVRGQVAHERDGVVLEHAQARLRWNLPPDVAGSTLGATSENGHDPVLVDIFQKGNTMSTMTDTQGRRTRRSFTDDYKTGAVRPGPR